MIGSPLGSRANRFRANWQLMSRNPAPEIPTCICRPSDSASPYAVLLPTIPYPPTPPYRILPCTGSDSSGKFTPRPYRTVRESLASCGSFSARLACFTTANPPLSVSGPPAMQLPPTVSQQSRPCTPRPLQPLPRYCVQIRPCPLHQYYIAHGVAACESPLAAGRQVPKFHVQA